MNSDNAEYIEPPSRLTKILALARENRQERERMRNLLEAFGNKVCWETVLELLCALKGIVDTCKGHTS